MYGVQSSVLQAFKQIKTDFTYIANGEVCRAVMLFELCLKTMAYRLERRLHKQVFNYLSKEMWSRSTYREISHTTRLVQNPYIIKSNSYVGEGLGGLDVRAGPRVPLGRRRRPDCDVHPFAGRTRRFGVLVLTGRERARLEQLHLMRGQEARLSGAEFARCGSAGGGRGGGRGGGESGGERAGRWRGKRRRRWRFA